jgi:hypothetical protein
MLTKEKVQHHINHLQEKHDTLDKEIQTLYNMHENDLKVEVLKKLKLQLKDEIERNKVQLNGLS